MDETMAAITLEHLLSYSFGIATSGNYSPDDST